MLGSWLLTSWFPFGGKSNTDSEKIDPSELSLTEIRKNIFKEERRLDRAENVLRKREAQYVQFIEAGAQATADRRRVFAIRARLEKFKAEVQELERLTALKNLAYWTALAGQKELEQLLTETDTGLDPAAIIDFDPTSFQEKADELQADISVKLHELDELMSALHTDSAVAGAETTVEEQLMDSVAEGLIDAETVEIDLDLKQEYLNEPSWAELPEYSIDSEQQSSESVDPSSTRTKRADSDEEPTFIHLDNDEEGEDV
jgi:hypothetical protein